MKKTIESFLSGFFLGVILYLIFNGDKSILALIRGGLIFGSILGILHELNKIKL